MLFIVILYCCHIDHRVSEISALYFSQHVFRCDSISSNIAWVSVSQSYICRNDWNNVKTSSKTLQNIAKIKKRSRKSRRSKTMKAKETIKTIRMIKTLIRFIWVNRVYSNHCRTIAIASIDLWSCSSISSSHPYYLCSNWIYVACLLCSTTRCPIKS